MFSTCRRGRRRGDRAAEKSQVLQIHRKPVCGFVAGVVDEVCNAQTASHIKGVLATGLFGFIIPNYLLNEPIT